MSLGGGDLQVILRRIRHGFIICDDTELCDKIISQDVEAEQRRRELAKSKAIDMEKTDLLNLLRNEPAFILDELSHSPEWTATNVQVQRVRCATLGRLDEIKTAKEVEQKTLRIPWQDPSRPKNADQPMHSKNGTDDDETSTPLFQRRTEPRQPLVQPSPLTALLQSGNLNQNPFAQYAKFDGTPNISANQSKRFVVHFKSQKLQTIVASVASVEEAIGFVCYKYTTENREPALTQTDPSKYSLCIADDFGQAEDDFPPLTHARPIGEYGFPHLALVEQSTTTSTGNASTTAKPLNYDENSSEDGDLDDESIDDSSQSITPPPSEPRRSVGSNEKPLSMAPAAAAAPSTQSEIDPINNLHRLYESLNQKSYHFDYYIKSGSSKHVKVRIDVSGEQVRFELAEKTSRLPWQSLLLTTQRLVDCALPVKESNKKRDRTRIYLVFDIQQESDGSRAFQTYEFESTVESAEQFRDQILSIIQLKNPHGREAYEEQQQSRRDPTKKRRSIFNIIGAGIGNSGSSAKS